MINPAYFESLGNETLEFLSKAEKLKKEKNAVVLAHFYEPIEIQLAADFVGDSLELARRCKDLECEKISRVWHVTAADGIAFLTSDDN